MNKDKSILVSDNMNACVGVVGGGVAGSTVALRLAELGIRVVLLEQGSSLVNGPPMCHLHAGGNFYREISDQQSLALLRQSIDTLRIYPCAANIRPTVFAVPVRDRGHPEDLLPRLHKLQSAYAELISKESANEVLGPASEYFKLYYRDELEALSEQDFPSVPQTLNDWMIPVARSLNLDDFKFPLIIVQEYGLSAFRIAATVSLAMQRLDACSVLTNSRVIGLSERQQDNGWVISYQSNISDTPESLSVDFLVNACGYRTGTLDDMAGYRGQRMVEFKAAYLSRWPTCRGVWPEVIFHGERGTPNGMAQFTPYPGGYFQLHGMTEEITLFKGGRVASCERSAQPKLGAQLLGKLSNGWENEELQWRTRKSIEHVAQYIPDFAEAEIGGGPLFGAQQIPGDDPSLRVADVSFPGPRYARSEIVKSSSALTVANEIVYKLRSEGLIDQNLDVETILEPRFPSAQLLSREEVDALAQQLALERNYPVSLA